MKLLIHMRLLSDAIFGSGMSMPGGEDICILTDEKGFPYMKGSTLKGIFRSELINYLDWCGTESECIENTVCRLLGEGGSNQLYNENKLIFSDLTLDGNVMRMVLEEHVSKEEVIDMFSYLRVFTELENGLAKKGSLRSGRCVKKDLSFYATCICKTEDGPLVKEVFQLIKWVGSMKNRGFGKVFTVVEEMHE